MTRIVTAGTLVGWLGLTLLFSQLRWFNRRPLTERLRPYAPGGLGQPTRTGFSVASFRDVIGPLAARLGSSIARLFGVSEELDARLRRFHSPLTVTAFRTRQLGWATAAFAGALVLAISVRLALPFSLLMTFGAPLLAFLLLEQQIQSESERWQRRIFLELPVVTEQLGLLLSAGYSLGAALNRLAERSNGAVAADLGRVAGRIRQGLSEMDALREWSDSAQVDALDRLVSVLALNREAADLGMLITAEARSIRDETHRELLETIERRSQMVWIPVTVATLVPGVIFIAVPFIDAMSLFSR